MIARTLAITELESRKRIHRSMAVSTGLHLLLVLLLVLLPKGDLESVRLTEIAFFEPGEPDAPISAGVTSVLPAGVPDARPEASPREDVRFERVESEADISPQPQSAQVIGDRMSERLSRIQEIAAERLSSTDPTAITAPGWSSGAGKAAASLGTGSSAIQLNRGGSGGTARGTAGITMKRGNGGSALVPALASGALDARAAAGPAPAEEAEEHARRQLAGATLMGPIADRPILHMVKPDYPEWAKSEAVEASVTLRFVVRPDGRVRESIMVEKTAGFQDFDENARSAIRTWRFQALGTGESGDQWGTITFHYRLRDAG